MKQPFDFDAWKQLLVDSLGELGSTVARIAPIVLAVMLVLAIGWGLARLAAWIVEKVLRRIGANRIAKKLSITSFLRQAGATSEPSAVIARILFWVLMLTFVSAVVENLGLHPVKGVVDRIAGLLPALVSAGMVLLVGVLLGSFARNVVAASNITEAPRLGSAAQGVIVVVAAVLAIDELGVETRLLVTVISVVIAAASVTMGIAFALGARPVITHILAGHFLRQSLLAGMSVEVQGRRGRVERVGPVDTLFRDGERSWTVPNARLLDEVVQR